MSEYMYPKFRETGMWRGVAEEAAELASAASKMERILCKDVPTPVTEEEQLEKCIEEYTDLYLYLDELGIMPDKEVSAKKYYRMKDRWGEYLETIRSLNRKECAKFEERICGVFSSETLRSGASPDQLSILDSMRDFLLSQFRDLCDVLEAHRNML